MHLSIILFLIAHFFNIPNLIHLMVEINFFILHCWKVLYLSFYYSFNIYSSTSYLLGCNLFQSDFVVDPGHFLKLYICKPMHLIANPILVSSLRDCEEAFLIYIKPWLFGATIQVVECITCWTQQIQLLIIWSTQLVWQQLGIQIVEQIWDPKRLEWTNTFY